MSALTDKRFTIGFGRGDDALSRAAGVPYANFRLLGDYIDILRGLWRGDRIDYDGLLGRIDGLRFGEPLETHPPLVMAAMGEKTCYWAGQQCDGVVFNSLWSADAVRNSVRAIRQGAADAGRDPASVKIWTILVSSCEAGEEYMLKSVIRRINTYLLFPPMFDVICDANSWDRTDAARLRELLSEIDRDKPKTGLMGDETTSRDLEDLRRIFEEYPNRWLDEGCAVGSAQTCAQRPFRKGLSG